MVSIVYAANNKNGFNVLLELRKMSVEIEYLIVHPKSKGRYVDEIIDASGLEIEKVIFWDKNNIDKITKKLSAKCSDILFSVNFGYIIPAHILQMFRLPINLHPGYLPYNKGAHPNVWAIIEETPAGVSIHRMTEEVDKGEILAQMEVEVQPWDTGKSLYEKLEKASIELVRDKFMDVVNGRVEPKKNEGGTLHYTKEFKRICEIDLDKYYKGKELINILRALTFPPYKNAYFVINGKKVFIDVRLYPEGEDKE